MMGTWVIPGLIPSTRHDGGWLSYACVDNCHHHGGRHEASAMESMKKENVWHWCAFLII